ncbi:hematopoietic cell signal transducer isoform X1 [Bos indicus]|uniref:Hematopoietic cell signal transducer isoform X1 n=1 Tax=Bos indicus TaxID=9915 RepID=A0ABM4QY84_BOSIN
MVPPGNILFLLLLPVATAQMTPVGAARGSAALSGSPLHHPHHQTEGPTMSQPPDLSSGVPVPDVGPSLCHSWQALWLRMLLCHC